MKLEVRISYEAMCKSDRATSPYKGQFYEMVELEIAETTAADAPVATETLPWKQQTRWFANRHFLPRYDEERVQGRQGLTTEEVLEIIQDGTLYALNYGYECFERNQRPSLFNANLYVEFDFAAREQAIAEAKLCFDRILLIDGDIWVECAEPYLIMREYGPELSYDIVGGGSSSRPNHRALDFLFHSKVVRADDPAAASSINVLIPESIVLQPERETIIDAAKFLLEDYSYFYLWDVHPQLFAAIGPVQALYAGRTRAEIDCEALVEPILHLVNQIERHETETRINNPSRIAGYRRAVECWIDRDVSISELLPAQTLRHGL
ncbi:hypothetical protein O9X98_04530 [Agrobacterium salinitolerans]|nr:hypothetical protein [Agrobacterium salinitolerans]